MAEKNTPAIRFEKKLWDTVCIPRDNLDEYTAENILFLPQDTRCAVIPANAHSSDISTIIDATMRSIETENKRLAQNLFPTSAGHCRANQKPL